MLPMRNSFAASQLPDYFEKIAPLQQKADVILLFTYAKIQKISDIYKFLSFFKDLCSLSRIVFTYYSINFHFINTPVIAERLQHTSIFKIKKGRAPHNNEESGLLWIYTKPGPSAL